jgi:hypothetical protein
MLLHVDIMFDPTTSFPRLALEEAHFEPPFSQLGPLLLYRRFFEHVDQFLCRECDWRLVVHVCSDSSYPILNQDRRSLVHSWVLTFQPPHHWGLDDVESVCSTLCEDYGCVTAVSLHQAH